MATAARDSSSVPPNSTLSSLVRRRALVASLSLAALGLAAYGNGFDGVFLFDDHVDIDRNEAIRSLTPLSRAVFDQGQSGVSGRPLVALSYALNYAWCGYETWGWHAVNLVIHVVTACLLYGALRVALSSPPFAGRWAGRARAVALASSAIWVVHPLTTGAVMYLGQRVESLMALFFAATFYFALRAFAAPERPVWRWLSVSACALGAGCKEVIVGAPVLVLAYDALFVSSSLKLALRGRRGFYGALFGTWILIAAAVVLAQGRSESVGFEYSEVGAWDYLTTQAWALVRYARLSLWPQPLIFDYGVRPITDPLRWGPPAALVLLALALTVRGLARRRGAGFLGAAWFVILAPSSSFLPIVTELIVEHRVYLPSALIVLGVVLASSSLLERAVRSEPLRRWLGVALTSAVCVAGVLATRARNRDYSSELRMWEDVVAKAPDNDRGRSSYANDLVSVGREQEAGPHFEAAVRLAPDNGYWRSNLGVWLLARNRVDEALVELERSRELLPDYGITLQNLGSAYLRKGERAKAQECWRRSLDHGAPMVGAVAKELTAMLVQEGREADALDACRAAARAAPNDPEVLALLARRLVSAKDASLRDAPQAVGLAQRASMLRGRSDPELFELIADALFQQGRSAEAAVALRNAAALWRSTDRIDRAEAAERRAQGAAGG